MIWDLITKWWIITAIGLAIVLYVVVVTLAAGSARWSSYLFVIYLCLLMAGCLVSCAKVFNGL
jgi:hypothetical protein